jgi:hypothetical protein
MHWMYLRQIVRKSRYLVGYREVSSHVSDIISKRFRPCFRVKKYLLEVMIVGPGSWQYCRARLR